MRHGWRPPPWAARCVLRPALSHALLGVRRCIAAEPHHGERWTAVSKAIENLRMKTEAILKRVVGDMAKEAKEKAAA